MRVANIAILILIIWGSAKAQSPGKMSEGEISYISSQNIYVKFQTTEGITSGDTLYLQMGQLMKPALKVISMSSSSCLCKPVTDLEFTVGQKMFARDPAIVKQDNQSEKILLNSHEVKDNNPEIIKNVTEEPETTKRKKSIRGRVGVSAYSRSSSYSENKSNRYRYTFSLKANHINNSRISADTYISFRHKTNEWNEVQDNIFNALKIYSFAINYKAEKELSFWMGRKINTRLSSIGAIDGLQIDKSFGRLTLGAFGGFRPDYSDYGFNFSLPQTGVYAELNLGKESNPIRSTLGLIEQRNTGNTDRRFIYFQNYSTLGKKAFLFTSFDIDLYKIIDENPESTFTLSSFYFSLRYRPVKKLSLTASFDSRKNVIYYETYKDLIDQLLEAETRKGFRFQFNYRPIKYMTLGSSFGYRFSDDSGKTPINIHSYITYGRVPFIKASTTLSYTFIQNSNLEGRILSIRMHKDFLKGKLSGNLGYRKVLYLYGISEFETNQNTGNISLTWRIMQKLSLSLNYDGTFQKTGRYNNFYAQLRQRF